MRYVDDMACSIDDVKITECISWGLGYTFMIAIFPHPKLIGSYKN